MCAAGTVSKQDEQEGENGRGGQMNAAGTVWRQDEQEGENGRGNICSGEDACKKNVKDGGGGGGEDKCACDNDKGKCVWWRECEKN